MPRDLVVDAISAGGWRQRMAPGRNPTTRRRREHGSSAGGWRQRMAPGRDPTTRRRREHGSSAGDGRSTADGGDHQREDDERSFQHGVSNHMIYAARVSGASLGRVLPSRFIDFTMAGELTRV